MADKLKGILIAMAAVAVLAIGGVAIATATSGDEPAQPARVGAQETENETGENETGENAAEENESDENEADEQASGPSGRTPMFGPPRVRVGGWSAEGSYRRGRPAPGGPEGRVV